VAKIKFKSLLEKIDNIKFESIGFNKEHNRVGLVEQQGPLCYFDRRPIYFRDCQNVGKGIYFSNYFAWMGKVRESAMMPILKDISNDFNSGKFGMVTNNTRLQILGDAGVGDILETRFGLLNKINDSTIEIFFVWKKRLNDGSYEELAYAEMAISWVEIISHGIVKASPFPAYYNDFIERMSNDADLPYVYNIQEYAFSSLEKGEQYYCAPPSPRRGKLIAEERITTTLEDGNSVGNVYFSNYGCWQGLVRDRFFYKIDKHYFENMGEEGEFVVLNCDINHLREVMPFSQILITMNVVDIWENAIGLTFEYFNVDNGDKIKLASGAQTLVWAKKDSKEMFKSSALPKVFVDKLLEQINKG